LTYQELMVNGYNTLSGRYEAWWLTSDRKFSAGHFRFRPSQVMNLVDFIADPKGIDEVRTFMITGKESFSLIRDEMAPGKMTERSFSADLKNLRDTILKTVPGALYDGSTAAAATLPSGNWRGALEKNGKTYPASAEAEPILGGGFLLLSLSVRPANLSIGAPPGRLGSDGAPVYEEFLLLGSREASGRSTAFLFNSDGEGWTLVVEASLDGALTLRGAESGTSLIRNVRIGEEGSLIIRQETSDRKDMRTFKTLLRKVLPPKR
jgi:hypothetical protein